MKYKPYGDYGVLILPWQNFSVSLYNGNATKDSQSIVDKECSAAIKQRFGGGHCDYIADHAGQGFDIIKDCKYTYPAVVQTPTSSKIYRWCATMLGTNTGKNLVACSGQALTSVKWADLCLYTCNDETGKNITMVLFKLQETVNRPIYEVEESPEPKEINKCIQATATVNVRKGPSTSYGIIGTLSKGSEVFYLGSTPNGDWYNVNYGNTAGWVSSKYSKLIENI